MKRVFVTIIATLFLFTSSSIIISKYSDAVGCQGCCSYHGGITNSCIGNRVRCVDGTASPTCECSCLYYSGSSGYSGGGGGGGGSVDAAAIAGAAAGLTLGALIVAALASNDPNKVNYGRILEKISKQIEKGEITESLEELRTGKYHIRSDTCNVFPSEISLIPAEEARLFIISILEDSLKKSKKNRAAIQKEITQLHSIKYTPIDYYALSDNSNRSYTWRVFPDGSMYIPNQSGERAVCTGSFSKKEHYKIIKIYCVTQGSYCRAKYLHESGTVDGKKRERMKKDDGDD